MKRILRSSFRNGRGLSGTHSFEIDNRKDKDAENTTCGPFKLLI